MNERNASLIAPSEIQNSTINKHKKNRIKQIDNAFLDLTMYYLPLFPKNLSVKISRCVQNLDDQI